MFGDPATTWRVELGGEPSLSQEAHASARKVTPPAGPRAWPTRRRKAIRVRIAYRAGSLTQRAELRYCGMFASVCVVDLLPLTRRAVLGVLATVRRPAEELLESLEQQDLGPLLVQPVTLKMIVNLIAAGCTSWVIMTAPCVGVAARPGRRFVQCFMHKRARLRRSSRFAPSCSTRACRRR